MAALFGGGKKKTEKKSALVSYADDADLQSQSLEELPRALRDDGRCRCWDRRLEVPGGLQDASLVKSQPMNPYIYGHDHRCTLYMPTCPQCGHTSGTHRWNCPFWADHPDQLPF